LPDGLKNGLWTKLQSKFCGQDAAFSIYRFLGDLFGLKFKVETRVIVNIELDERRIIPEALQTLNPKIGSQDMWQTYPSSLSMITVALICTAPT
jgi:hypothetical protein